MDRERHASGLQRNVLTFLVHFVVQLAARNEVRDINAVCYALVTSFYPFCGIPNYPGFWGSKMTSLLFLCTNIACKG